MDMALDKLQSGVVFDAYLLFVFIKDATNYVKPNVMRTSFSKNKHTNRQNRFVA